MKKYINLLNYRKNVYSSIGNDGIMEYIFDKLNIGKGFFVEFGAWDGIKNNNCKLLVEKGWRGIFIEDDKNRYKNLKNNYIKHKEITCLNKRVGFTKDNLFDNIVCPYLNTHNIDFCSIDIDGLDLEVFETFKKYLPSVICIEGGQMLHPYHSRVKTSIAKKNIQQSLSVMVNSFQEKGYKILCSYQDSFFIKKELYDYFFITTVLLSLYFDGLRAIPRRMPFIQKYMKRVNLKNSIVDYILNKSHYKKYGWNNRKQWIVDNKVIINFLIDKIEKIEMEKIK